MIGNAETRDGMARKLVGTLVVGDSYTTTQIAAMIGNRSMQGGVIPKDDAQIFLVTLLDLKYPDEIINDTLHWYGQKTMKHAEQHLMAGTRDSFVFIRDKAPQPFKYYGRAILNRMLWKAPGTPSEVILEMPEYAAHSGIIQTYSDCVSDQDILYSPVSRNVEKTEIQRLSTVRTEQSRYRKAALALWNNRCAVTGVDETNWLIASHIKPWRESDNSERIDPRNSLILTPNYDKLFDRGVISFSPNDGRIMLPKIHTHEMWKNLERMHIDDEVRLSCVPDGTDRFLHYHNTRKFGYTINDGKSNEELIEELVVRAMA